ncbi:PAS domain S-box protein [Flammeovirga kamogawensis]|uniref:histidine kinase n=1 Tax=Flammeovirga kamogawensis TaxID=373891 RepID=A0ABX8GW18_9BACT|nr:PAS domain S-box protein [Flammeovirga kamogawensis]MBB6461235.1 PAS domain S-box-containing protein [Flammeovirga kamogawensis]QWG07795.1 PAS domain S-box protein [Flammeovirga kamogawensis]TRX69601.1 PAS domain S-box protein [Flammeovirga kamogawensis]
MQALLQNRPNKRNTSNNQQKHYILINNNGNVKYISKDFLNGVHTFEVGRSIAVGLSPKNQIKLKKKITEALIKDETISFNFTISQNSRPHTYKVQLYPIHIDNSYVNATFKLINQERDLQLKRLKDTYFHSIDGIIWVDPFSKDILYANPAFSKIAGYQASDDVITKTFHDFVPSNLNKEAKSVFAELKKKKHVIRETYIKKKDDEIIPVQITASIVSSDDDTPYIVCFIKDLSALISARKELKDNQQRYEAILDNSKIKICQFDENLKLTWCGSSLNRKTTDFLRDEHVGLDLKKILKKDAANEIFNFQKEVLEANITAHKSFKIGFNIEWKAIELYLSPIIVNKKVIGLNAVFLNISNQKKVEEKLDHFVYRAAHDLRGPLTTVQGLIHLMKVDTRNPQQFIKLLDETIWTQDMHLQKILAYYYNQKTDINSKPIDFTLIHSELVDFLENSGYIINISFSNNTTLDKTITSDAERIALLFKNICTTILQLVSRDISIKLLIEIKLHKNGVYLSFTDNVSPRNPVASNNGFDRSMSLNFAHDDFSRGIFITSEIVDKLQGKYQVKYSSNKMQKLEILLPNI